MASNLEARSILQGLFDKWNGKSKEVVNEVKVEDVQTTITSQPSKIYDLTFYRHKENRGRYQVRFGSYNVCSCYDYERDQVEKDFNKYKLGGYSTLETANALKLKYNLNKIPGKEYSFTKASSRPNAKTILFNYRIDGKMRQICYCRNHYKTKEKVLNHCRELVSQGKSFEEIRAIMKPVYSSRKDITLKNMEDNAPKAPLKWDSNGRLLFYNTDTNLTPYNLDVICSLHANYDNPFTFGDYVLQNLPRALPSAVFYLCENYDMIPKLSSEGKKILDKR